MTFLDLTKLQQTQKVDYGNGKVVYIKGGLLHNENGAAVVTPTYKEYYVNGVLHNDKGPARIFINAPDGNERVCEWWLNGKFIATGIIDHEVFHQHWSKP